MEREYIVTLKAGVDFNQFDAEMTASTGAGAIPNRTVDIADPRTGNTRNTHYALTADEVETLRSDTRVEAVELPPEQRDDVEIGLLGRQSGTFTKTSADTGNHLNWGMRRCIDTTNPYSGTNVSGDYTYNLDGEGVDVVIQDSGIEPNHPEWQDESGVSRLKQIDWFATYSGSGSQSSTHYRDFHGHGTHVAGTAAGLTYGWAKKAHIYSVKVNGLEGSGDSGGISTSRCFDVIKDWHNSKTNGRPTVVNMSWGYGSTFSNITGGNYRGTSWSGSSRDTSKGMVGSLTFSGYRYTTRVASVDADLEELIAAGVHVCVAAGNSRQKIDIPGGLDYDNYFTSSSVSSNRYYNRGGSPFSTNAFVVGNIDYVDHSGGLEQKNSSSETGPGVDIYAPGTHIRSASSQTNAIGGVSYYRDSNYKQTSITGTSMASPQVCGAIACILQAYPNLTPAEMKSMVHNLCAENQIFQTGLDNDYAQSRSLIGGPNRYLFFPYSREFALSIT